MEKVFKVILKVGLAQVGLCQPVFMVKDVTRKNNREERSAVNKKSAKNEKTNKFKKGPRQKAEPCQN